MRVHIGVYMLLIKELARPCIGEHVILFQLIERNIISLLCPLFPIHYKALSQFSIFVATSRIS